MSISKHIPNTITSLNLLCGSLGVVLATKDYLAIAFVFMLAGAVFDFFDGFSARALGAYSPVGKELDSLADQVTFGLLPAVMLMQAAGFCLGSRSVVAWIPVLIAVFSGLRLAKFNVDERQSSSFIGLPTPASAMVCGSLAAFIESGVCPPQLIVSSGWIISILSALICFLLVSEIPMFSFKMHKGDKFGWKRTTFVICAVVSVILVLALGWYWTLVLLFTFVSYILINISSAFAKQS